MTVGGWTYRAAVGEEGSVTEAHAVGRKPNGRSSIYLGADGRWHGRVSMGLRPDGRPDRRHVTGATEAVVTKKVQLLEQQRAAGRVAAAGMKSPTVAQWLDHWLDNIAARTLRPRTAEGYRSKIDNHVIPVLGSVKLEALQPEHLEQLYRDLAELKGLAPNSILQVHRILSRALKVAVQRGRAARNVATLVDAPKAQRSEIEPLLPEQAQSLITAAAKLRNGARWSVALALGLRQGEALGLTWQDIDLDSGTLTVRQALQRVKGKGLVLVPPKSSAGRRVIALPYPLLLALKSHRSTQGKERLTAGALWHNGDLVFCQADGKPIDPKQDWKNWKALLAVAGVRDARLHDARHTAATLLIAQGVSERVVMQIMGHSQISLTHVYTHVLPTMAGDAADRMGAALWPVPDAGQTAT